MGICGIGADCTPQRQTDGVLIGMAVTLVAVTALGVWHHLSQGSGKLPPIDEIKLPPIDDIVPIPGSILTKATQTLRESQPTREALVAYLDAERAAFGRLVVRDLGPNVVPWESSDWGKWMDTVLVETRNQYHTRAHVLGALSEPHPMGALPPMLRSPFESWGKIKQALAQQVTTTKEFLENLVGRLTPRERLDYDHLATFLSQQLAGLNDNAHLQGIANAIGA